jgi:L-lactate dehydrogenase complex protein LldF
MANNFHQHIRSALENTSLQAALDGNAERRAAARDTAYKTLPEPWAVMRSRASAVRTETIANLDQYLAKFTQKTKDNGFIVHYAADAYAANEIVLGIARRNNAKLIAKSKSMVSEEISLNHMLEKEGIQVIETDLGEYIVQLRGERPSHIITPAVHLRRKEVGQTFHEQLGIPLTEDIPTLTKAARQELRQVFLDADIGISGVNFGVAETGTLCILTNEGNGRMVTTLPDIHIALMGIERLVPNMDDLALMLYLLPRSATGQKITVYTNFINAPAAPDDLDGPKERHLILIDNGRKKMRHSPLQEALSCIRCGACLSACPVFREIGGHAYVNTLGESSIYPGPIGSVVSPGLFGVREFGHLARASSLCGACREVCPVDIDLPKLLLRVRAGQTDEQSDIPSKPNAPRYLTWALKVYTWLATHPGLFAFAQKMAGLLGSITPGWIKLPASSGWGLSKDFPSPARRSFRDRFQAREVEFDQNRNHPVNLIETTRLPQPDKDLKTDLQAVPPERSALIDQFEGELTTLGGKFWRCSHLDLAEKILDILNKKNINTVAAWEKDNLPPGLLDKIKETGVQVTHLPDPTVRVGLTGASAGIAETGTIILPGGTGRSLSASLLPETHIAILEAKDIYAYLSEAVNLKEITNRSSSIFISGPSRTADIEMTLTIGVHGPGEVYVLCVDH